MPRKYYVGTMGWSKGWGEKYYPKKIKKDRLKYFSREFSSIEINSTFYRLPQKEVFDKWKQDTPSNFVFSVKMNRYLTHVKRLILDKKSLAYLKYFIENSSWLGNKFAVVLIQLPPSFSKNTERLKNFLTECKKEILKKKLRVKTAIEFRHNSWFASEVFSLLKKYKVALVLVDYPEDLSQKDVILTDFVYARIYGDEKVHRRKYLEKKLKNWAEKFRHYPERIKKIYIYFSEDFSAYAVEDARFLIKELNE